jgi:hypothetical protein
VFLAGLTPRLVHDLIQILFALNDVYYVGDGNNLWYIEKFKVQPADFAARVTAILYPGSAADSLREQYDRLAALIDDVVALADANMVK